MKTYQVTMDDSRCEKIAAQNAADAIQLALIKNPGHTVTACALRDPIGNGMNFDIPKHAALTEDQVRELKPKREQREHGQVDSRALKPAPWIQEWMDRRNLAAKP